MRLLTTTLAILSMVGQGQSQFNPETGLDIPCFEGSDYSQCFSCSIEEYPASCPERPAHRGVRREIRDLTKQQWEDFVFAMYKMKDLSMEEGRQLYGNRFKTFTYMTSKHAISGHSKRGDQAHFGAWFMSFHSAYTLEYEESIMAIVKASNATGERQLEGMPYWWNLDNNASEVLSPEYFGTHPGLGINYTVNDGAFANWTIPRYEEFEANYTQYITNETDNGFVGNPHGWIRSERNWNDSPYYVAYPLKDGAAYQGQDYAEVEACINTTYEPNKFNIVNFTSCTDSEYPNVKWHGNTHFLIGGQAWPDSDWFKPEHNNTWGDMRDTATSSNAPLFPSFHATVDMVTREWASRSGEAGARQLWGLLFTNASSYMPQLQELLGLAYPGVNGNDTINSGWPTSWYDMGWAEEGSANENHHVTHAESHCCLAKENAPYVYARYSKAPVGAPGEDIPNPFLVKSNHVPTTTNVPTIVPTSPPSSSPSEAPSEAAPSNSPSLVPSEAPTTSPTSNLRGQQTQEVQHEQGMADTLYAATLIVLCILAVAVAALTMALLRTCIRRKR